MNIIHDIKLPSIETMAQRIMSITGYTEEAELAKMVKIVRDVEEYCRNNAISDGVCGMRSLIDWTLSTMITNDPYASAEYTLIPKASADENAQAGIKTTILDNEYPVAGRRSAAA